MNGSRGYYKVYFEFSGFKIPVVVYAGSGALAASKAFNNYYYKLAGARLQEIEGPYHTENALELC